MNDVPAPPPEPTDPTPPPAPPLVPAAAAPLATGQVGTPRKIGITILLFIVTCGIYGLFWTYWVFDENKKWSGEGIGGLLGLLIQLIFGLINWFLLPSEIQRIYERDGRQSPVSPLLGLWFLLPIVGGIIWYVKVQQALNDFWISKGAPAPA
jgi:hypothetical protein